MIDPNNAVVVRIEVNANSAIEGSRKATEAWARMEKSLDQSKTALERMEGGLGRVGGFLKAQIALQVADIAARFVGMAKAALEAASGLDELAEQLGVSNRTLQALQFSAVQNGVKLEQLETGISKFSQKMGEAADGSKEMIEALDRIGVKNLDVQGKLRPTEDLLQDVAQAIIGIDDPARRAAAAVDFFGKTGMRMLPMLADIADGADLMAAKMEKAGAYVLPEASKRLDAFGDAAQRSGLRWRAFFANAAAGLLQFYEDNKTFFAAATMGLATLIEQFARDPESITGPIVEAFRKARIAVEDWYDKAHQAFDDTIIAGGRFVGAFMALFSTLPDQIGKVFVDGMNKALAALEDGLNKLSAGFANSWLGKQVGATGGTISLGRLAGGGASLGDLSAGMQRGADAAEDTLRGRGYGQDYSARRAQQREIDFADWFAKREASAAGLTTPPTKGASTSAVKGAGQSEADAIAKALRGAQLDVDTQTALAEASERGARAVADLEVHFKALKAAQDAYGKTADANKAGVEALTATLEKQYKLIEKGKNFKEFSLGTEELEKQNVLLAAENRLINASTEDRARELALIKTKFEVQAKGLSENDAEERKAIERRNDAIFQNERLKAQGEELKKANELWTAPLKSALESIQRTGADMWEQLLENGKFSAEEFGQIFAKMARRAAAELLALATIRPVINMAVQGLGSIGLVSPATASSLGYGSTSSGGISGGGFSGGGGSLFPSLGLGNIGGSIGGWLNSPISFGGPIQYGSSPAGQAMPHGASSGLFGGVTWGQGLSALAGAGAGIYQLATARGNTAKTIGGIASMVGAGVSLIPGVGQIAGPIISILGSLLPGLFGGGEERPPMPPLNYGAGVIYPSARGFVYGGDSLNAGQPMTEAARGIGGRVDTLFSRAGLTVVPGQLIGGDIASGTNNTWANGGWQGQNYTQIGLHTPTGYERITYNDPSRSLEQATDLLIAAIFKSNILRGGVSGASETLKTAVRTANPATEKGVTDLVDFVATYDKLGKAVNTAKDALQKIDQKFIDMAKSAGDYGLAVQPVTEAQAKERKRYAQDYIDAMLDPLQVDLRLLKDQRESALASAEYIRDNIKDVYVDINKITDYYLKKEADLKKKYIEDSYGDLQKVIDKLTFGTLANASPLLQFTGQRGSYLATLAQAKAGSFDATNRLADVADAYATAGQAYFGSSAEYAALAEQIRKDLIERQSAVLGGDTGKETAQTNALLKETMGLQANIASLTDTLRTQSDQIAALTAQLARR